jgi:hypothetical protein
MLKSLRGAGLTFFLLASAGPASAMDQSAMEETNCLMACDANQENCHPPGAVSVRQNLSRAEYSSPRGARSTTRMSKAYEATLAHSKEVRR